MLSRFYDCSRNKMENGILLMVSQRHSVFLTGEVFVGQVLPDNSEEYQNNKYYAMEFLLSIFAAWEILKI